MMSAYVTLFDSNYLDKGIVTLTSLLKHAPTAHAYVLAMDEQCLSILNRVMLNVVTVISLQEFEDEELRRARADRSRAEYCFTCSSHLIQYVMNHYKESIVTYIDADMFFYSDPEVLICEMLDAGCSVQVVEHGFRDNFMGRLLRKTSGRFCVEFNTFCDNEEGRAVLDRWCEQALNSCSIETQDGTTFGDQMYLEHWPEEYQCVHILAHKGGGVAPWNIDRYRLMDACNDTIRVRHDEGEETELIFYHFHDLKHIDRETVDYGVYRRYWSVDNTLVERIYFPYVRSLQETKEMLFETTGFYPLLTVHPAFSRARRTDGVRRVINAVKKGPINWRSHAETEAKRLLNCKKDIHRINRA